MPSPRASIRTLLTALVVTVAFPLGAWSVYRGYQSRTTRIQGFADQLQGASNAAALGIEQVLMGSRQVVEGLAVDPALAALDARMCQERLYGLAASLRPFFRSVELWDADGRLLCVGPRAGDAAGSPARSTGSAERSWRLQESLETSGVLVTPAFRESGSGRVVAALTHPVRSPDGPAGVVAALVDLTRLQDILRDLPVPDGALVTVVDDAGGILAGSGDGGGEDYEWRLRAVRGTRWTVHAGLPRGLFDAPVRGGAVEALLVGLALLLLGGLGGASVYRRIAHPLDALARNLDRIGAEPQLKATFPALDGPEEVARLSRQLDGAWTRIRERQGRTSERDKMEALSRMASGIAHDFNNILTVLGGQADLLRHDPTLSAAHRDQASEIYDASFRGTALVRRLMDFCRGESNAGQEFEPDAVVEQMRRKLEHVAGPDVTVTLELGGVPAVRGDPAQLEQVLVNLVANARDAIVGRGSVRIATGVTRITPEEAREFVSAAAGPHVVLSVKDDGPGIPDTVLPYIFEPFYTTRAGGEGAGLGLATVYGVVTGSRGHIQVRTGPSGTRFDVFLPCAHTVDPAGTSTTTVAKKPRYVHGE